MVTGERPPTAAEAVADALPESVKPYAGIVVMLVGALAAFRPAAAALVLALLAGAFVARAVGTEREPRVDRKKVSYPGMSEEEVWRRAIALDELVQMRNDKAEDESKSVQRRQGQLPGV